MNIQNNILNRIGLTPGTAFGLIMVICLIGFELFNYGVTEFALSDLLGDLAFAGLTWATIFALACCGFCFAGIARLFTPQDGVNNRTGNWCLFGAWLLVATANVILTWWGISIALINHDSLGNAVVERETLLKVGPIFGVILLCLIRVLIIGTFSTAWSKLYNPVNLPLQDSPHTIPDRKMKKAIESKKTPALSRGLFDPNQPRGSGIKNVRKRLGI